MSDFPQLISLNAASEMTSLSRTMINRLRAEGRFPAAVSLGEKRIAFPREVTTAADSRTVLIEMLQRARAEHGGGRRRRRSGRAPCLRMP